MIYKLLGLLMRLGLHMGRNNRGGRGGRGGSRSRANPASDVDGVNYAALQAGFDNRPAKYPHLEGRPPDLDNPVMPEAKPPGSSGWNHINDTNTLTDLTNLGNFDWGTRQHILYGEGGRHGLEDSGGHHHEAEVKNKTHFPQHWDEQTTMDMVSDVATNPDTTPQAREPAGSGWIVTGNRGGVNIEVVLNRDGTVWSGYPTGGDGVYEYRGPLPE